MARRKFKTNDKIIRISDGRTSFAERLKGHRVKSGLSAKDIAEALDVTANAVYNWESGRARPDIAIIPALCICLGISITELFTDETILAEDREHLEDYHALNVSHRRYIFNITKELLECEKKEIRTDIVYLPQVPIQAAAGIGFPEEVARASVPTYLYDDRYSRQADFAITINGDSMEPMYHNGDIVIAKNADLTQIRPGDIGIFYTEGTCFIKQFQPDGLYSLNPKYPPMLFKSYDEITVVGRVLAVVYPEDYPSEEEVALYKQSQEK